MKPAVICGLILASQLFGQIEIRYSRQSDPIVKALVGTVPKDIAIYRADVVNLGPTEARIYPSRVGFEAAVTAPMQDPESALFAAQNFRNTRWWVVALKAGALAAPYSGAALMGLQAFGIKIPDVANLVTGGASGAAALFTGLHKEAATLTIPATWLRDGMPEIILRPGEPVPYLLALGGNPPLGFTATVGGAEAPKIQFVPAPTLQPPGVGIGLRTAPQIPEITGPVTHPDGTIDVSATIMAARQSQAEYVGWGMSQ